MRSSRLLIIIAGIVVLVNDSSASHKELARRSRKIDDSAVRRMASDQLVVEDYDKEEAAENAATLTLPDDSAEYQIYQGVMGRPGIDFPVYSDIPASNFNCRNVKKSGYYADLETDCQVFHICDGTRKISFLCPNGTIFRQSHLICDWWFRVDCGKSIELYDESAEQLAADQKVYKARSNDKERRRKLVKTSLGEPEEEQTLGQVQNIDRQDQNHRGSIQEQQEQQKQYSDPQAESTIHNHTNIVQRPPKGRFPQHDRYFESTPYVDDKSATPQYPRINQQPVSRLSVFSQQTTRQPAHNPYLDDVNQNKKLFAGNSLNTAEETFQESASGRLVGNEQYPSVESRSTTEVFVTESSTARFDSQKTSYVTISPAGINSHQEEVAAVQDNYERQQLAETASFANNRGGRTFQNFQAVNQFSVGKLTVKEEQLSQELKFPVTPDIVTPIGTEPPSRGDFRPTVPPTFSSRPTQPSSSYRAETRPAYKPTVPIINTSTTPRTLRTKTDARVKTEMHHVYTPASQTVVFNSRIIKSGTSYPPTAEELVERQKSSTKRVPIESIYFTTTEPSESSATDISDLHGEFGARLSGTEAERAKFLKDAIAQNPDLVISLQELAIHAAQQYPTEETRAFNDSHRDGLEVPPSSGPTALRSFALYFADPATSVDDPTEQGSPLPLFFSNLETHSSTPVYEDLPTTVTEKNIIEEVNEFINTTPGTTVPVPTITELPAELNKLPSSLTQQTKDSYSNLFGTNETKEEDSAIATTPFESFTEIPNKINTELTKNDLDGSQSRGLVEPEPKKEEESNVASPDLRELAQVFTKALSAYLDDPEAFRRVLSEIRPTEPSPSKSSIVTPTPVEYPSATQEDDEVLDFSDVTKVSYKKKTTTGQTTVETTTSSSFETTTLPYNQDDNLVLPLSIGNDSIAPVRNEISLDLSAPLENLDEGQSNYYTVPPNYQSERGTTNSIAEEINQGFSSSGDTLPEIESNEADGSNSYFPTAGGVNDQTRPRYGGFQNNSRRNQYQPYGSELTSTRRDDDVTTTTYSPYGAELTTITRVPPAATIVTTVKPAVSTFKPSPSHPPTDLTPPHASADEIALAKALNNLAAHDIPLLTTIDGRPTKPEKVSLYSSRYDKSSLTTTTRGTTKYRPPTTTTTPKPTTRLQNVKLGNGETLERTLTRGRQGKKIPDIAAVPVTDNQFQEELDPKEINLELSPPVEFVNRFSVEDLKLSSPTTRAPFLSRVPGIIRQYTTSQPEETTTEIFTTTNDYETTTYPTTTPYVTRPTTTETIIPTTYTTREFYRVTTRRGSVPTTTTTTTTEQPLKRLMELQQTLMFNTTNVSNLEREKAKVVVEQMVGNMSMSDVTAEALMKMMEVAAKNETYRRLVLLLVHDKSGKNKTVQEARVALLKALLTPIMSKKVVGEMFDGENSRRNKALKDEEPLTTTQATRTSRRTTIKPTKIIKRTKLKSVHRVKSTLPPITTTERLLGNLGIIRKTIENSRRGTKTGNTIDEPVQESDSRAVELLRSLYSLAARWG